MIDTAMSGSEREPDPGRTSTPALTESEVRVRTSGVELVGDLTVPADAEGVVLFAHGSGSSRQSPRNRFVARELQRAGFATLLIDLLTAEEERVDEQTAALRFDITLLSARLVAAVDWLTQTLADAPLSIGCFGASTGAAAALAAAAERPDAVLTVVSRGGRPDLAYDSLALVRAPTLLVVGGFDHDVLTLNERAAAVMNAPVKIEVIPRATHLFEEPGALERVADLAAAWFRAHLARSSSME